jgi:hypothetical protein
VLTFFLEFVDYEKISGYNSGWSFADFVPAVMQSSGARAYNPGFETAESYS